LNLILLGSTGFLGRFLKISLQNIRGFQLITPGRRELIKDGTIDKNFRELLLRSDVLINCIADTNFTSCDNSKVSEANEMIPELLEKFSSESLYKIHFSTDAFYEDRKNFSSEKSKLTINSSYAKQKYNSEKFFLNNSVIIRTSFVGDNHRGTGMVNYVKDNNNKIIDGWNDVFTSSVHLKHIYDLVLEIIKRRPVGTYNFGTNAAYSKFDFLKSFCEKLKLPIKVKEVNASFNSSRNKNCGMDSRKIFQELNIDLPTFEDVVDQCALHFKL
tara:strand:+ start:1113 stop:1928 length:816 start_codon:yes stop_codon:yes gene_type:complete